MTDQNTTPPAPTPQPEPKKKSAAIRGEINALWLAEISGTEKLAVIAAKDAYKTKLAKRKVDAAWITKLTVNLAQARILAGLATGKTTGRKVASKTEKDLKLALVELSLIHI